MFIIQCVSASDSAIRPSKGEESTSLAEELESGHIHDSLHDSIRNCLKDSCSRVQLAATFCLFALGEQTQEMVDILEANLEKGESDIANTCIVI